MKKWLPLALAAVALWVAFSPGPAAAQAWNLILRAGGSNGQMVGNQSLGSEGENGLAAGIAAELRLNEDFGLEFGLTYLQKGASGTITNAVGTSPSNPPPPDPTLTFEGSSQLDYLEISALAAFFLAVGEKADARFYLGASLGNLLSAEATGTFNGEPVETDLKDGLSQIDFEGVVGATFGVDLRRVMLLLELRSWIGLVDIEDSILDVNIRTRTTTLTLGVSIPLASAE